MNSISVIILAVLVLVNKIGAAIISAPKGPSFDLLILHNNDMHARFEQTSQLSSICSQVDKEQNKCYGGFARVANRVKDAREKASRGEGPPVLYLNAGDTYTGTIWFALYKWRIAADFINMLHPDAVSLGNHELDNGVAGLSPFIKNLTCPVLTANIDVHAEPLIRDEPNLKKSIVLDVIGKKIGVIGYLTPDTKFLVAPNKIEYSDEVVAIQKEVNNLRNAGVKFLIALGHSGFETDKRIAREVEGIDLVIGGHTNTFLWNGKMPDLEQAVGPYPTIIQQNSGKKVPVVQAYAYTKYLGRLHLKIDSEGDIVEYDGQPILLDGSIPRDPEILSLLESYRPGIDNYTTHVVGKTQVLLDGTTNSCRLKECNLGNLISDSMVYAYISKFGSSPDSWTDFPIALIQGGGIRSSIDASKSDGNVTRADLLSVLPFDNDMIAINITGKALKKALEWSVHNFNEVEMNGGFLQYSGIIVEYDISQPAGKRLVSAQARCGNCLVPKYSPISDDEVYKVLITEFLSYGGDNFSMFKDDIISNKFLGMNDVEILSDFITKRSPIYPEVQGRITVYKTKGNLGISVSPSIYLIISMAFIYFKTSSL